KRNRRLRGVAEGVFAGETQRRFVRRVLTFRQPLAESIKELTGDWVSCQLFLPQPIQVAVTAHEKAFPDHQFLGCHSVLPLAGELGSCARMRSASTSRSALMTCVVRSSAISSCLMISSVSASHQRR